MKHIPPPELLVAPTSIDVLVVPTAVVATFALLGAEVPLPGPLDVAPPAPAG